MKEKTFLQNTQLALFIFLRENEFGCYIYY